NALFWLPVVFYQHCFAIMIYPFIRVHTGTLHHAVVCRYTPWRINKCHHMETFRRVRAKVEKTLAILNIRDRIRLKSMDHIRKFYRITDKENLYVIPD